MTPRTCLVAAALLLCIAAAPGMAEPPGGSVYRIAPLTTNEVSLDSGVLRQNPPARLLLLALEPAGSGRAMKYQHFMPSRTGGSEPIDLKVRELTFIDVDLARRHPFEYPFKRVLVYWGCGDNPGHKQPRATLLQREDDARLSERLAPRPIESSRVRRLSDVPADQRMIARGDIRFPEHLQLRGSHELRRDDRVSRFEVTDRGAFLSPVEITRVWVSDEGSVRLQWKRRAGIAAYFVTAYMQQKDTFDVVIWTSSRVAEAGWILSQSHPGGATVAKLRSSGVLLAPETETCTVPAAVARHADQPVVVQLHAYGEEVEVETRRDEHPLVSKVRISPRAIASVFLEDTTRRTAASASAPGYWQ